MKKTLFSVVAALSLTLASAAFAQSTSTPTNDKTPPPPSGSAGSETTGAPSRDSEVGKSDTVKKTGDKSKQGSDSSSDKPGATKY